MGRACQPSGRNAFVNPRLVELTDVLTGELTDFLGQCCPELGLDQRRILLLTIWALLFGHAMSTLSRPLQPETTQTLQPHRVQQAILDTRLRLVADAQRQPS